MLLFSLLVAGSFSFGKQIANDIDPVALTAVRFALTAALLAAGLAFMGQLKPTHFRAPWRFFMLGGVFVVYFVFMFEALKTATPVSTSAIFTTMPLLAALMDWLVFRRRSRLLIWAALAIGATGALWVVFRGSLGALLGMNIGPGERIFFAGTIAHALNTDLVTVVRRKNGVGLWWSFRIELRIQQPGCARKLPSEVVLPAP